MVYLCIKHFASNKENLIADMEWTYCVLWFLSLSMSEGWKLTDSQPVIQGKVQSPRYPHPYAPNLMKQWDIWVPKGYKIQLFFTHLDIKASLGCNQDSLTVLYKQKVLGKFCGQEGSTDYPGREPILSEGNRLTLIFQTSDSTAELQQHTGFSATYKAIDIDECSKKDLQGVSGPLCSQICVNTPGSYHCSCHNGYKLHLDHHTCLLSCGDCIFDKHEGHLSSPGYPDPSPPFLSCKYIISVEPRFTVALNFTDNFHIESVDTQRGPECQHHWLQVTIPGREPLKFCDGKSPGVIDTNSSTVRLDYHTDKEGSSLGWRLQYSTYGQGQKVKCRFPGNVANGRVTPVLTEYLFGDYIYVTCEREHKMIMGGREIKSFSAMCQSNGQWHRPLPECQICGQSTKLISPYRSDGPDNTIPWHVLLNINGRIGGAMVITDRWIMTAAHILTHNKGDTASVESVQIYMGLSDVDSLYKAPVYAASLHVHPEYNNSNGLEFDNDIALIKLQVPVIFNSSIIPICLPGEGATYATGMIGLMSGFSYIQIDNKQILTYELKYVKLSVVDEETCSNSTTLLKQKKKRVPNLTNNMFCAGLPEDGKNSCLSDSGGPFALSDEDGRFWVAGIVSWGVDCQQPGTYGIFTRVTNYLDWIKNTMQEN